MYFPTLSEFVYGNLNSNAFFATIIFEENNPRLENEIKIAIKTIQQYSKTNEKFKKEVLIKATLKGSLMINPNKTRILFTEMEKLYSEMSLRLNNIHYFQTQLFRGLISIKNEIPYIDTVDNYKTSLDVLKEHKNVFIDGDYKIFRLFNSFRNLFAHAPIEYLRLKINKDVFSELMNLLILINNFNQAMLGIYKKELNQIYLTYRDEFLEEEKNEEVA